jgi:hypothetical protein
MTQGTSYLDASGNTGTKHLAGNPGQQQNPNRSDRIVPVVWFTFNVWNKTFRRRYKRITFKSPEFESRSWTVIQIPKSSSLDNCDFDMKLT